MSQAIELTKDGPVALLTIVNSNKRNALSRDMRMDMVAKLMALYADRECRAIVITGQGGHFSAGADISNVDSDAPPWTVLETRTNVSEVHQLVRTVVNGQKPIIAAVEGVAYGAGFALSLACDHVVAAQSARFGAAFSKIGLMADFGLLWSLKERVGAARAKRIMLLGREVSGEQAMAMGLIEESTPQGGALEAAFETARAYAETAPLAVAFTKAAYARGITRLEDALACELDYVPILNRSDDFLAGIEAFKTKSKPKFQGS